MRVNIWGLVTVGFLLIARWAGAEELDVRLFPSTTKISKTLPLPTGSQTIRVEMAQNEYEAFQIVLKAGSEAVGDVYVEISDLVSPAGNVLPASEAELYLEYYVEITFPSPCDAFFGKKCDLFPIYQREVGWYPDALLPFYDPYSESHMAVAVPFIVEANDLQTVFVDLHSALDQPAGIYAGEIRVIVGGAVVKTLSLEVVVWNFAIPTKRNIATAFGYNVNSANKYHGGADGINSPEEQYIFQNYELEVHRHRMDATELKFPVEYKFDEQDNLLPVDWTAYDAYVGPRVDGSYYPDGAGVARFEFGSFSPGHGTGNLTPTQYSKAAKAAAEHLQEKGWLKHVYLYSTDEPWMPAQRANGSYEKIKTDWGYLNALTDLWKGHVLVTGPWMEALDAFVDIWCPVTPMYGHTYWPKGSFPEPAKYKKLMDAGKELWFYVCNANFPGFMGYDVDTKLGYEPRLVKWGAWSEGATGFLYWRLTYWQEEDPWHLLINLPGFGEIFSRQGDGVLIYPGNHDGPLGTGSPEGVELDGPVVSYRMKQVRDGLEDWEMFLLASELGGEEYTRSQVGRAYTAFGATLTADFNISNPPWTLDEEVLLDVRRQVALKVQYLTNPDTYVDPEAPIVVEEEPTEPSPEVVDTDVKPQDVSVAETVGTSDSLTDVPLTDIPLADVIGNGGGGKSAGGCAIGYSSDSVTPAWTLLVAALCGLLLRFKRRLQGL